MEPTASDTGNNPPILNYIEPNGPGAGFIRIRRFNSLTEANLAALNLESHGITTQLNGADLRGYGALTGDLEISVREVDAGAAIRILDDIDARIARRRARSEERSRCPRCGSSAHRSYGLRWIFGWLLVATGTLLFILSCIPSVGFSSAAPLLVIGGLALIFLSAGQRKCGTCGKIWTPTMTDYSDDPEEADPPDSPNAPDSSDLSAGDD